MAYEATDGEKMLAEMVFEGLGRIGNGLEIDFSDEGNGIYVTDGVDGKHYNITIKED